MRERCSSAPECTKAAPLPVRRNKSNVLESVHRAPHRSQPSQPGLCSCGPLRRRRSIRPGRQPPRKARRNERCSPPRGSPSCRTVGQPLLGKKLKNEGESLSLRGRRNSGGTNIRWEESCEASELPANLAESVLGAPSSSSSRQRPQHTGPAGRGQLESATCCLARSRAGSAAHATGC